MSQLSTCQNPALHLRVYLALLGGDTVSERFPEEPRIKKSTKPEIEERLPPHLDKEHYEITEHGALERRSPVSGERKNRKYRDSKRYLSFRIYFYLCIILLIGIMVETVAFGYFLTKSEDSLQIERDRNVKMADQLEQLKNEKKEADNAYKGELDDLRNEKNTLFKYLDNIRSSDHLLGMLYCYFTIEVKTVEEGDTPISVTIEPPGETDLENFGIKQEEVSIRITIEKNGEFFRVLKPKDNMLSNRESIFCDVGSDLEPGFYEIVFEIFYNQKTYRISIHSWDIGNN
ncbi:MAG: hypothetical protein WBA22_05430 [Candidatus Methanofastidiosia archaeon]